jgi:osmotically-inducible protein OsmY
MLFLFCLELLSNAARATDPREEKTLRNKIAALESPDTQAQQVELKTSSRSVTRPLSEQIEFDKAANKVNDQVLVQTIRHQLLTDETLSRNGKNIQIIVVGKEITLKGPVNSDREENHILDLASKISDKHKIRNQLEVIRE